MQDNVPMEVKKERLQRLNALVNEHSAKYERVSRSNCGSAC